MFTFLMLLLGGGFMAVGVMMLKRNEALKQVCTAQTSGVVARIDKDVRMVTYEDMDEEDVKRRTKTREETSYYSVFEYSVGELSFTKTGRTGSGKPQFRVGEKVTVYYNPDNPDEFHVAEDTSSNQLALIGLIGGAAIAVMGIVVFFL